MWPLGRLSGEFPDTPPDLRPRGVARRPSPRSLNHVSDFEQLAAALDLRGKTIVDVGCGDGAFVRRLRAAGADAIGIEVSADAVAHARAADLDGCYLRGTAEALPLEDASVDIATLMLSLHHVPDPRAAFPELARVVREHVWIAEPLPHGDFFELMRPVDDETAVRANAQRALAAQTHFEPEATTHYDVTFAIDSFDEFKRRVLAADPERTARFTRLEAALRRAFTPGDFTVPMRADLLRRR